MFEVKPWDTETDLKELFGKICAVRASPFLQYSVCVPFFIPHEIFSEAVFRVHRRPVRPVSWYVLILHPIYAPNFPLMLAKQQPL